MADRIIQIQGKRVPFVWGHVYKVEEVGPYSIVKYRTSKPSNAKPGWKAETSFHPYVDGKDTGHSYGSLDSALVACVVFRREWKRFGINAALNERLTGYVMRALGEEEGE